MRKKLRWDLGLLDSLEKTEASKTVVETLSALTVFNEPSNRVVLLYAAMPNEINPASMLQHDADRVCVLPRVIPGKGVVECRRFTSTQDLYCGSYGILEPSPEQCPLVPPNEIDLAVIPGCAFSVLGQRLGHGGGYYDRLLGRKDFRAYTIGICFECQLYDQLPTEPHDCDVDCVITEQGVRWQV